MHVCRFSWSTCILNSMLASNGMDLANADLERVYGIYVFYEAGSVSVLRRFNVASSTKLWGMVGLRH